MAIIIPVAHDFICPWCWIGYSQAQRLRLEFDIEIEWRGYELWPIELAWPEPNSKPDAPNKPVVVRPALPSKLELALVAEGLPPTSEERPKRMRSNNAHQAVEFAKTLGLEEIMISKMYRAYWMRGEEINHIEVIRKLSESFIPNIEEMEIAIERVAFADKVVHFDKPSYDLGIYNVPTFWIGEELVAEQPYKVLRDKIALFLAK